MMYAVTVSINGLTIEIASFKRYSDAEFFVRMYWLNERTPYEDGIYIAKDGFIYYSMRD